MGLEIVKRFGPSMVGIDTIYNSKGKIPEVFLRGCGVPQEMIDFARMITGKAIEFYSCFISYSSKDEDFAKRVHADLQSKGVRVWKEEKEKRTVLFPIRLDDAFLDTTEDWADDIRRNRHVGDFKQWKDHDHYQAAFDRLLRDLRASESS